MAAAKQSGCEIVLPVDAVVTKEFKAGAEHFICDINAIPKDGMIVDYGPKSVEALKERLLKTKTVLWNGPLGAFEIEPFGEGTFAVAREAARLTREEEARHHCRRRRYRLGAERGRASPRTSPMCRRPAAPSSNGSRGGPCRRWRRKSPSANGTRNCRAERGS